MAAASKVNPKQQKQAVDLITNGLLEGAAEGGEERGQSNSLISWLVNDVTTLQETVLQTLAEKDNEITRLETLYNTLMAGMKEDLQKLTKTLEARDAHIEQLKLHVEIANSAVCEHKQQIEHSEKEQTTSEKDSNAVEKKTAKKVKVHNVYLESKSWTDLKEGESIGEMFDELKRKNETQKEQINSLLTKKQSVHDMVRTLETLNGEQLAKMEKLENQEELAKKTEEKLLAQIATIDERNLRLRRKVQRQEKHGKEEQKRDRKAFTKLVLKLKSKLRSQIDNSMFLKLKLAELDSKKEAPISSAGKEAKKPDACRVCTGCRRKKQCKKIARWNSKHAAIQTEEKKQCEKIANSKQTAIQAEESSPSTFLASTSQVTKQNLSLAEHEGKQPPLIRIVPTAGLQKEDEAGWRPGGRQREGGRGRNHGS